MTTDFKITSMTPEILAEKFPEVFKAIEDKGYAKGCIDGDVKGKKEGHINGFNAGAEAERKRIKDVESQLLPGHEALITQFKADGKTTGEQAAIAVLNAEKEKRKTRMQTLEDSAIRPVTPSNTDALLFQGVDPNLPVEERAKAEWDKSSEIRTEFTSFNSYLAYKKASEAGRVRILSKAKSA